MKQHMTLFLKFLLFSMILMTMPSWAHDGNIGQGSGFIAGFMHPASGPDHIVAMIGVGIWGAFLGGTAIWTLPVAFPLIMAIGGILGLAIGIPWHGIEIGIAFSSIILGILICFSIRLPLLIAVLIIAVFAICHGYAHGLEIPKTAHPLAYCIGFMLCTGLLHLVGIGIGYLIHWRSGRTIVQILGALISCAGIYFLISPL